MVVRKYLTVLSGKYPANLHRIPDSAGCLNFTGYRYPDPAHPYTNGGNRWNILGFNFTKRDALSSLYKISMFRTDKAISSINILALTLQLTFLSASRVLNDGTRSS